MTPIEQINIEQIKKEIERLRTYANSSHDAFEPEAFCKLLDVIEKLVDGIAMADRHLTIPAAEHVPAIHETWEIFSNTVAEAAALMGGRE